MARLTKLGRLLDKMLDNPESWTLYGTQDVIRHSASGWFLKVTLEHELEFPNWPALTNEDKAALYPKAVAVKKHLGTKKTTDGYNKDRNRRYRNRRHIYNSIIRSVMGVE